ncbi:RimJ/RimL family protein N-acetyltransferase [Crossiella equi]|uniref:RimJ/RimL family protein N-acetyltransferase n=1 Tax=Crossiella equi TaxID=130796 RepID=A0ABS5AEI3_9PSEU|nr:GNAT family N-acetyltransferase [Crossiella equi]MBP2474662.1 RimJ/RimL family protein N-acetyltransferase [Crossiella equi]
MEPVEINAGSFYLRQLRADKLMDDRPAVLTAFTDPELRRWVTGYRIDDLDGAGRYVALRAQEWREDLRCSWAVAEPTTGEMLAEVGLKDLDLDRGIGSAACWTHPEHRGKGIMTQALQTALRFGIDGLGLRHIGYRCAVGNDSSRRVAEKCGFTLDATLLQATTVDGQLHDVLAWSLIV